MRLVIGNFENGKLEPAFHQTGDDVPNETLQALKGQFRDEYRAANIRLTEEQLLAAATPDQDAIQTIHALMQLDSTLNGLGKYLFEWHNLHHPDSTAPWEELTLRELEEPGLKELGLGVRAMLQSREQVTEKLEAQMRTLMPNTSAILGGVLAAKLLDHAGSVERLARFPASIIQLLGAERALFRFLRSRGGDPPKHGVLVSHPLVQGVPTYRRGKMARKLANAVAIAARVDAFGGDEIAPTLIQKLEVAKLAIART
jgi:nucleolar protein 56